MHREHKFAKKSSIDEKQFGTGEDQDRIPHVPKFPSMKFWVL